MVNPLNFSSARFARLKGSNLFERTQGYYDWIQARHEAGFWPYARYLGSKPEPIAEIAYLTNTPQMGINLAVQDYLSLSNHPLIQEEAIRVIKNFGVHSAGSPILLGNNRLSLNLENDISELVDMEHVLLFPTGWAAGFGVIKGLIRSNDHIVMDELSHTCLQEGASASTLKIHRHEHLNIQKIEEILKKIRSIDTENAILVITEGLFSMDSDRPRIDKLQEVCHSFEATLLVDVAHDLGSMGENGGGQLELQNMLGKVDLIIGAFSKPFASNGGFVATRDYRIKQYLRFFATSHTFSNAMSPIQCGVVSAAIRIIQSEEGRMLRRKLLAVSNEFRNCLQSLNLSPLGETSAIVPIVIGSEKTARIASKFISEAGLFTNLVEFPGVGRGSARFRCQLMANHSNEQVQEAARIIAHSIKNANDVEKIGMKEGESLTV